jgi:hypothetical protein
MSAKSEVLQPTAGSSLSQFREFLLSVRKSNNVKSLFTRIEELRSTGSLTNEHLLMAIRSLDKMKGVSKDTHILPLIESYKAQLLQTRERYSAEDGWYDSEEILSIIRTCGKINRTDVAEQFLLEAFLFDATTTDTSTTTTTSSNTAQQDTVQVPSDNDRPTGRDGHFLHPLSSTQ